jgi:hypothetical protein
MLANKSASVDTLRVSFPVKKAVSEYEPTEIHLAPEYIFLETIYSPLVEMSTQGKIEPGVAKSYEWRGDDLYLHIRDDLKTQSGYTITAADAAFSLKRLLIRSGNTHGNFRDLVCPGHELKSVEENCPGIKVEGQTLILSSGGRKSFLVPLLAAIDFAVIPKFAVDPVTLNIKDYSQTSGPYYVEKDHGGGNIALKINKSHYHYNSKMASTIELIPTQPEVGRNSMNDFDEDKVDLITTIDSSRPEEIIDFAKSQSHSNFHSTMNIRTFVAVFTKKGFDRFTREERLSVASKIQKTTQDVLGHRSGYSPSSQFFPPFGEGALDTVRLHEIQEIYKAALPQSNVVKPIKIACIRIGNIEPLKKAIEAMMPNIQVVESKDLPDFSKFSSDAEIPDMFISGPDTSFQEDISLISYSLSVGFFGMSKEDRLAWLAKYMTIDDKAKRLEVLTNEHYQSLKDGILIPLVVAPYVALSKEPWKIKLSSLFANNPLWLIQKD